MKIFVQILCWTAVLLSSKNCVVEAEKKILYTTSSGAYTDWFAVSPQKQFQFNIRARAFTLNLATYPVNEFPKIEIGISHPHASNTGVIWRDNVDVKSVRIDQEYNANEQKFMGYWVTWHNNIIKIGLEGESKAFLMWNDPKPFPINYIGVHTIASDNQGIWIIEQESTYQPIDVRIN